MLWVVATQAASAVEGQSIVLMMRGAGDLQILAAMPPEDDLGTADWAAARWAVDHGEAAGWNTGTMPGARFLYLPLRTPHAVIGCIGIRPGTGKFSDETRRVLDGLVGQASVALERTKLVSEAADAKTTAEAEKLRVTLLSSISHDFRTPLASIVGSISALRSLGTKMPAEDREDLLANIEEEAQHLSRFVTNLLDMTKLEGGAVQPRYDAVDVTEVTAAVVRRAKAIWPHRLFNTRWDSGGVSMQGDASLLDQLLFNLIENACKYTPADMPVDVNVSRNLDRIILTVEDQGPGIPPQELERVFEKFHRVAPGDGRPSGTGLGLAICKAIAGALGGTVHAESPAADGHGTRFVVNLPAERR
ncbi:ATP-binding protein [Aestuariivirga sp.]|uniref:sensor histidine kinase n=1 Tax=Aestuariivirga sp. TaxID=2650926 RepID=UPI0039E611FA